MFLYKLPVLFKRVWIKTQRAWTFSATYVHIYRQRLAKLKLLSFKSVHGGTKGWTHQVWPLDGASRCWRFFKPFRSFSGVLNCTKTQNYHWVVDDHICTKTSTEKCLKNVGKPRHPQLCQQGASSAEKHHVRGSNAHKKLPQEPFGRFFLSVLVNTKY